ncbi:SusD-like starch-binding protein associating with outer membrane [Flavobacterium araucananum]|uniref:RagB/SusD family nutrient uptake outer membrane protein n=1 Tax=Flavobacterium araucananum TaxID=946678 RepID=A0A227NHJ3_9FLAO|nr:RagB/SusD family nutrient uptake outer membrane protein [Flavobacterium araucananum]OXE96519.1 RagB/SusD family nutrient uptake outer membrane protein [Flavobacterium araucananum]PWJ98935.1 SusD-like starch-binding protein associating with outer membrane [Flavobacterium araucananum]
MKSNDIKQLFSIIAILVLTSCSKDFLEKEPTEFVDYNAATKTTENLMTTLNGIHRSLYIRYESNQNECGLGGLMQQTDIVGDDIVFPVTNGWFLAVYNWSGLSNENAQDVRFPYRTYYRIIRNANTVINAADVAIGSTEDKNIVKGQALLYRAFCHFQLVQLFGKRYVNGETNAQQGVPIILTVGNDNYPRSTVEEVYTQINKDLDEANVLLTGYLKPNNSHLDLKVAQGLKARVSLTQGNWAIAVDYANQARSGMNLMNVTEYKAGFNDYNNKEWMWGSHINEVQTDYFGNFGAYMSRNYNSTVIRSCPKAINSKLYNLIPPSDVRATIFSKDGKHPGLSLASNFAKFPYTSQKFLSISTGDSRCDVPYMRVAEMYLIEAEAKARLGQADAAILLFDFEKTRNPQYVLSANTGQALVEEILVQRRIELWGEGFRFFDLKRTNSSLDRTGANHDSAIVNGVLTVPSTDKRWQWLIPRAEINANPLVKQNEL